MTAAAAALYPTTFELDALPAVAFEGLALAGFELAEPRSFDAARGPIGAVLIRAKESGAERWLSLGTLEWARTPVDVLHELLCAECRRPLLDNATVFHTVRGHGRMVSVRNFHLECAPARSP